MDRKILYQAGVKTAAFGNRPRTKKRWREFKSPLAAGQASSSAVLVFGDTATVGARVLAPAIAQNGLQEYNLALHMGDTSYATNRGECYDEPFNVDKSSKCGFDCRAPTDCHGAGDRLGELEMQRLYEWATVMDNTVAGRVSMVGTPGNHDNDAPFQLTHRARLQVDFDAAVSTRDKKLLLQEQGKQPMFFSHDHGLVHVITIGTEDNPVNAYEKWDGAPHSKEMQRRFDLHYGKQSMQYRWLEADLKLANANRNLVPWIVLFTHRPMYHTAEHHVWCGKGGDWYACKFLAVYEPLFRQYGVNLVLAGHSHHYARTLPMYDNQIDLLRGQVHAIVGNGGTELIGDKWHSTPDWLASRQGTKLGFARFWVHNKTSLYWEHLTLNGNDAQVQDAVWIKNLFV